ncbi:hypothetical protein FERRO_00870 [Ferrovum sp. JA12]|uniref:hypothetical protein n=1 Tax=Ferrovum sp. JA12 TaxID=1356299 RepID=UPI000714F388|nr:hypothetical protein [Ferrovum sp. JA12]KRH79026.1 hypothetical protein FERRO_00870 [Ferrovum sp. JA12]
MTPLEHPSKSAHRDTPELGRSPCQEIAQLLAAGILRAHTVPTVASPCQHEATAGDIPLGFTGHQRVHTNPSQQEGVSV